LILLAWDTKCLRIGGNIIRQLQYLDYLYCVDGSAFPFIQYRKTPEFRKEISFSELLIAIDAK